MIQRLSRSVLLALVACALVAFPASAALDGSGCPDGSTQWVYASGSTGIGWLATPGNGINTATSVAQFECSQAWSNVGVNPTYSMYMNVVYGVGDPTWSYACIACINSIVQNLNHAVEDLAIDFGGAGGIGGQVGGGIVIGVDLKDVKSPDGPKYHVDVLRETEIVQVIVDARTGEAHVVGEEEAASTKR